ncbi:ribokinase [Sinomonas atrocyanea]|uniref:ribokinase n=1 Tax=Sinomonas atrocyanea TaxID=37927 RepID=UPI0019A0A519|nr:ribokinase [Sinomonas atrocyanea]GGG78925.1 ribokinase [Sinomonas atrocyanea]
MDSTVVVVGSLNADLVFSAERMPAPGETVAGTGFAVHPGGKSANQAVAAARLGAAVRLVGSVGDDAHGRLLLASATAAGVDVSAVRAAGGVPTGVAGITVDAEGENSIVIVPGANALLGPAEVAEAARPPLAAFEGSAVVCLCLEVPQAAVLAAARAGRAAGALVLLNLSPYASVPAELAACVDVLLVNAQEAGQLLGRDGLGSGALDWDLVRTGLADLGFERAIVTLGPRGGMVLGPDGTAQIETIGVETVDTTGAGDGFAGALAARLAAGDGLEDAARYAAGAAALATTRHGAQPSYPDADEVRAALSREAAGS